MLIHKEAVKQMKIHLAQLLADIHLLTHIHLLHSYTCMDTHTLTLTLTLGQCSHG